MAVIHKKKHPYYNYARLFSFNAVLMFLCGGRGLGKTYGAKKKAVRDALSKGHQFMYVRRHKDEISMAMRTFFNDLVHNNEFPDWDFRVNEKRAEASPKSLADEGKKRPWKTIGYFVALSQAQQLKSNSYPDVTLIIFDEFILEKSHTHYLPGEVDTLLNLYNTVDRNQDKTRVLMLANSVSIMNPYFIRYDIEPDKAGNELFTKFDGFVAVHFPSAADFAESVRATRFGQFLENYDPDYANYAIGNTFKDSNDALVAVKDAKARYRYTLITDKGTFRVWHNVFTGNYYAVTKGIGNENRYTLDPLKVTDEVKLLLKTDKRMQALRTAFRQTRLYFDKASTRNALAEIFK